MEVAVDISMYPLVAEYEAPIIDFIKRLRSHTDIAVATNQLSTQVSGPYDVVMHAIQQEMKTSLSAGPVCSFVLKVLNVAIEPGKAVEL